MKKYLSFMLCLLMVFGVFNVTLVQASGKPGNLSASYVKFSATQGGAALTTFPAADTSIYASADVTNNGTDPKAAVLWVGVYQKSVLVDVEYQRLEIPGGTTATFTTPAIAIQAEYNINDTDIKAYIWDSFTGANAVVGSANFLKDSGDLKNIYIDGVALANFSNSKVQYLYLSASTTKPIIQAVANDNATKTEVSNFSLPGQAIVTVTLSNGTVKTFNITVKIKGSFLDGSGNRITALAKNTQAPKQTGTITIADGLAAGDSANFSPATDRSWELNYISADLLGDTLIRMPLGDIRLSSSGSEDTMKVWMNGNNTYYTFTADKPGRIICLAPGNLTNYTNAANGWTTINNGVSFYTKETVRDRNRTYTDYNKYKEDGSTTIITKGNDTASQVDWLTKTYAPTNSTTVTKVQPGNPAYAGEHKYAYAKYFNAGEVVSVPTPNAAGNGTGEVTVWVVQWGVTSNPVTDVAPAETQIEQ